jgi:transcriptional regulator with XRE-family HTH domain
MQENNAIDVILFASGKIVSASLVEMKLVDRLRETFQKMSQTQFAQLSGVRDSTVARWKNGQVDDPSFESCLRIAMALNVDPLTIFDEAIGDKDKREDFKKLYRRFLPEWVEQQSRVQCADHQDLIDKLEGILHVTPDGKNWPSAITANIEAIHSVATGQPIEPSRKIAIVEAERATGPPRGVKPARQRVRK